MEMTKTPQAETQTVLVFKTNLNATRDVINIEPILNNITEITGWSVDIDDIDKVLRVEGPAKITTKIIKVLKHVGYQCEELNH